MLPLEGIQESRGRICFATPQTDFIKRDAMRAQAWHLAGLSTSGAPFELTVEGLRRRRLVIWLSHILLES
jgi:hypothetical protein